MAGPAGWIAGLATETGPEHQQQPVSQSLKSLTEDRITAVSLPGAAASNLLLVRWCESKIYTLRCARQWNCRQKHSRSGVDFASDLERFAARKQSSRSLTQSGMREHHTL